MFGIVIHFAILWLLITIFTRQTNADQSNREAKIVLIGMGFVWIVTRWLFGGVLGFLTIPIEVAALYLLIDKVCETSKGITVRICLWFVVLASMVYGLFFILESLFWD